MKILIIGSGYLSLQLASYFLRQKLDLTLTSRNIEKCRQLHTLGYSALCLDLSKISSFEIILKNFDTLIVIVAPTDQESYEKTYLHSAKVIQNSLKLLTSFKSIVYISSTSVYGEQKGKITTESSACHLDHPNAQILKESEDLFLNARSDHIAILRLSEIYGPGREFLTKLKQRIHAQFPGDGKQFVNAVHSDDICLGIDFVLKNKLEGIFNLACPDHPTRKQFYEAICLKYELPQVQWNPDLKSHFVTNKIISSEKICSLGYTFIYPNLIY